VDTALKAFQWIGSLGVPTDGSPAVFSTVDRLLMRSNRWYNLTNAWASAVVMAV